MSDVSNSSLFLFIGDLSTLLVDAPDDSIISRTVLKTDDAKVVLFRFAAGQSLSEHTAACDAILHFLSGEATVGLGSEVQDAHAGTWIHMQARLPHSVTARTPLTMLLILLQAAGGSAGD
jgi:quercetin dioxygenase-like cupin family protein